MRGALLLLWLAVLCLTQAHRCPPRGEVKLASSRSDCGYIQCRNGSGRWCDCPDGYYFAENKQCCVPRYSRSSPNKQNRPSSGGGNGKRPQNSGGGSGGSGGGSGGGGGGGGTDGWDPGWDHHW